jgi:hypothetical protein
MRAALLTFLVLLGYVAILGVAFLLVASIFTKRFSRFWRPCFYFCLLALAALLLLIPISGSISDDFANNDAMFLPLVVACLALRRDAANKAIRDCLVGDQSLYQRQSAPRLVAGCFFC